MLITCFPEDVQMTTRLSRLHEANRESSGDHSTSTTLLLHRSKAIAKP